MHKIPVPLAFVTVNYNGLEDTRALIRSIVEASIGVEFRIVVVDNGSFNDEWTPLTYEFPFLLGGRSDKNLGFAGGNNLGVTFVDASFYYFVNNDTLMPSEAASEIESMLAFLSSDNSIGGLCPKIKYFEPANLLQYAGCTPLSLITLRNKQIGYQEYDKGQYEAIKQVPYMHGAAMLVRQEVLQKVGLMPEFYFLYYEELDWCAQINKHFKLYYYPLATILHKESATTGAGSPLKVYYLSRNRLLYAARNRRGMIRLLAILYLVVMQVFKGFFQVIGGKKETGQAILRGTKEGLKWTLKVN